MKVVCMSLECCIGHVVVGDTDNRPIHQLLREKDVSINYSPSIKNTSVNNTVTPVDILLHYHEHGPCSLFSSFTYFILQVYSHVPLWENI